MSGKGTQETPKAAGRGGAEQRRASSSGAPADRSEKIRNVALVGRLDAGTTMLPERWWSSPSAITGMSPVSGDCRDRHFYRVGRIAGGAKLSPAYQLRERAPLDGHREHLDSLHHAG